MARTYTVDELMTRMRKIGEYEVFDDDYSNDAPSAPSNETLITFIDVAHRKAWEAWSAADEGWNLTRVTGSTVADQSLYQLPEDFHRMKALEVRSSAVTIPGWSKLARANADDDAYDVASLGGLPTCYRLFGSQFELLPNPGSDLTYRVSYTPQAARISSSLQTIPGDDGFDEVVCYEALVMSRRREEKDTSEFRLAAATVMQTFESSIKRRDRGAPKRMRPRGGDRLGRRRAYTR